ncbi:MAG: hypothetical protein ACLVCR_03610 [Lachnospiraceae bacterium]
MNDEALTSCGRFLDKAADRVSALIGAESISRQIKEFVPTERVFVPERKKGKKICYDRKHKGMRDRIKEVSSEWLGNLAEKVVIPVA